MDDYISKVQRFSDSLTEIQNSNFQINTLLNLLHKIRDISKDELDLMITDLIRLIPQNDDIDSFQRGDFLRDFVSLKRFVRKTYGFVAKGDLITESMGIGVAIGVAIGAGLMTVSAGLMGAGIALGVGIGLAIGTKREKQEEDKGNVY